MTDDRDIERRAMGLLEEALSRPPDERDDWIRTRTSDDEPLRQRTSQLLSSLDEASVQLATGGPLEYFDDEKAPEKIGAYRIVERIGRGGMGAVFRARRDAGDFEHEVAIKLVRPGILTDPLVERFERERQILAQLVHPHIARLYDGGTSEDGGPFMVMEFIDGVPITEWAADQDLALEKRIELMISVYRAVGFAHQNLIIHRDLTPHNVLVTSDGKPKLIDFGIARPQEDPDAVPQSAGVGKLSLTPGYAAPERYSGAPATTLTDIYSLGKLLESLLEPFPADADLAAIVEQATAEDPKERYTSAGAMARDLRNVLDIQPVDARGGGRSYAFGKFLRRQKLAVGAGALVLLALVGGLTATALGFREARIAQAEAEQRFGEVRSLAKTMLFDVYDSVDAVPGSTEAREKLAATAQEYLDTLASDPDAPFDVRLEAGQGYARLAHVMGGVGGGNLGQREEALANYERADEILSQLHSEAPGNREVALAFADLRYDRSNVMVHIAEDYEEGLTLARSIDGILETACAEGDECNLRRAKAGVAEGQNLYWSEDFENAVSAFERTIALAEGLQPELRQSEDVVRLEAVAYRLKGDARYYLDDAPGSVNDYDVAIGLLKAAMSRGIDSPDMGRDLAITLWTRGGSLDEIDRTDEAIAALEEASAIMRAQVDADPKDAGSLRLLAIMEGQRGLTLSSARRFDEAVAAAQFSLETRQRLSDLQPDQPGFFRDVAIQLNGLGEIHSRAGNRAEACRFYRATVRQFDELDEQWEMSDFDRNDTYARAKAGLAGC